MKFCIFRSTVSFAGDQQINASAVQKGIYRSSHLLSLHSCWNVFATDIMKKWLLTHKQISYNGIACSNIADHLLKKLWACCLPCLATFHKTNTILCLKVFANINTFFRVGIIWKTTVFLSSSLKMVISTSVNYL